MYQVGASRRTQENGERKILVDQTRCANVYRQLNEIWPTLLSQIPEEMIRLSPTSFSTPRITSKKARDHEDSSSDNDSYGSLLTTGTTGTDNITIGSEGEVKKVDEYSTMDELPKAYRQPSYAEMVTVSKESTGSTLLSYPNTEISAYETWQKEKRELESQIQNQAQRLQQQTEHISRQEDRIDSIQVALEEKITRSYDLEEQLARALDLAQSRDARHDEMMDKFEQMLRQQTFLMTHTVQTEHHPPSRPMTVNSPPPKKVNTNTSPSRATNALSQIPTSRPSTMNQYFAARKKPPSLAVQDMTVVDDQKPHRQLTGTLTSLQTTRQRSLHNLLTQPMDTDNDTAKPKPGATLGKRQNDRAKLPGIQ